MNFPRFPVSLTSRRSQSLLRGHLNRSHLPEWSPFRLIQSQLIRLPTQGVGITHRCIYQKAEILGANLEFCPSTMYILNRMFCITNIYTEKYLFWQSRYASLLETLLLQQVLILKDPGTTVSVYRSDSPDLPPNDLYPISKVIIYYRTSNLQIFLELLGKSRS